MATVCHEFLFKAISMDSGFVIVVCVSVSIKYFEACFEGTEYFYVDRFV